MHMIYHNFPELQHISNKKKPIKCVYSLCSYSMIISPTQPQQWHMGCKSHCPLQRVSSVYLCLFFGSSVCPLVIYFSLQCGFLHPSLFVMIVFNYSPDYNWRFLDASSHLYKRVRPSVGRSIRRSVHPSVMCFFY